MLSQIIFVFHLFQRHEHSLPYPKTKEKQKLPEIKKLTSKTLSNEINHEKLNTSLLS